MSNCGNPGESLFYFYKEAVNHEQFSGKNF